MKGTIDFQMKDRAHADIYLQKSSAIVYIRYLRCMMRTALTTIATIILGIQQGWININSNLLGIQC